MGHDEGPDRQMLQTHVSGRDPVLADARGGFDLTQREPRAPAKRWWVHAVGLRKGVTSQAPTWVAPT